MCGGEATHLTFIEFTITFEEEGLAMNTGAEGPTDLEGD
jgi:hypothetical protein